MTTPDYARLSRHLGALAYHIQQTGTADGQDAQTCLEAAEALMGRAERTAMTTPDYARLIAEAEAAQEWMRQPDWADNFSLGDMVDWLRQRPTSILPKLTTALRTLLERNKELEQERDELKHDVRRYVEIASDEATRAEAAEAKLAEAMKVIRQIDAALNDQFAAGMEERDGGSARRQERLMKSGEELRRAARKFLKENGNGE